MIPLKYSCEEIYERMENGLCIFCEEQDIPGHQLKHKGLRIIMMEREDDLASDDIEEVHQIQKAVKNHDPFVGTVKNSDPVVEPLDCASVSQVLNSVSDVLMVHKVDSHVKEVEESPQQSANGNGKNVAHQVFDQMPLRVTSKEKQRKSLNAWKFKFKTSLETSKLLDDKLSFVEESSEKDITELEPHHKLGEAQQGFKIEMCSGFDLEACIGLKIYGCDREYKKQIKHVWHRWRNKAENVHAVSEFRRRGIFYDAEGKRQIDIEDDINKADAMCEFNHFQGSTCGTIRHKLFLVRETSRIGYEENSWSFIWISFKELCAARFEMERETRKKSFKGLSKLENDKRMLSPESLFVHILYQFKERESIEFSECHNHLKQLLEAREELLQKIACCLICGDGKFHLKHKWKSRLLQTLSGLEFCVDNVVLITSFVKLLLPKNHKLLHPEAGFCNQYKDLEQLNTDFQSSSGLDYFTYLIFIWNQALFWGCEADHISSGTFSIGDVHGFFTCSKLQIGDETQGKRLLVLNEIPLLELIDLHGHPDFITKVLVQWKEHPPDQPTWKYYQDFISTYLSISLVILEDKDLFT